MSNNFDHLWNDLPIEERERLMPHIIENQKTHIIQCKQKAVEAHKKHMKELNSWLHNLDMELRTTKGERRMSEEINTTDEQVEQNEMEKILYSGGNLGVMKSEAIRCYNKLLAENQELEKQAEFFKKECDRFGDEAISIEVYKEHSVYLEDLTEEERQQVKDYVQKLRNERVETECWYLVKLNKYHLPIAMYLTSNKRWASASNGKSISIETHDFNKYEIIQRLYTADELEGK